MVLERIAGLLGARASRRRNAVQGQTPNSIREIEQSGEALILYKDRVLPHLMPGGDIRQALKALDEIINRCRDSKRKDDRRALRFLMQRKLTFLTDLNHEAAIADLCDEIYRRFAKSREFWNSRAVTIAVATKASLLWQSGQYELALRAANEAIDRSNFSCDFELVLYRTTALYVKVKSLIALKMISAAIKACSDLYSQEGPNPEVRWAFARAHRGSCFIRLARFHDALDDFDALIKEGHGTKDLVTQEYLAAAFAYKEGLLYRLNRPKDALLTHRAFTARFEDEKTRSDAKSTVKMIRRDLKSYSKEGDNILRLPLARFVGRNASEFDLAALDASVSVSDERVSENSGVIRLRSAGRNVPNSTVERTEGDLSPPEQQKFRILTKSEIAAIKKLAKENPWGTRTDRGVPYRTDVFEYVADIYKRFIPGITQQILFDADRSIESYYKKRKSEAGLPEGLFIPAGPEARDLLDTDPRRKLWRELERERNRARRDGKAPRPRRKTASLKL